MAKSIYKIVLRKEAITNNMKTYFTGKHCKHGHIAERYTKTGNCSVCHSTYKKSHYQQNLDEYKERAKKFSEENPGYRTVTMRKWRKKNYKLWLAGTIERNRRRQITESKATPLWSNRDNIIKVYLESSWLTEKTKTQHHVHHIIPLQECNNVCGLHCEDNLIILTEEEHKFYHSRVQRLKSLWY